MNFIDDCVAHAVVGCRCICCKDMVERRRCNAVPFRAACDCHDSPEHERCDCAMCRQFLEARAALKGADE